MRPLVVHVVPETSDAGAENQARYLVEELARRCTWELEIAYFRQGRAHERFEALGIPLRQVRVRTSLLVDLVPRALALRALYRRRPPDVLHTWLYEANMVGAVAARGWRATRLVVTQRSGSIERTVPHVTRTTWLIRTRADHAIANSAEGLALLRDRGFPATASSLIPNGFPRSNRLESPVDDSARALARQRLSVDSARPIVGYVGRADPAKDLDTLFGAMGHVWQAMPEALLLLVGPRAEDVRRFPGGDGDRILVTGWLSAPVELLPAIDVLVSSSWTEGHSNSVCEGLLAGVPVACTDTGDHVEAVRATGGQVVPIRQPAALGHGILQLLADPPDRGRVARVAGAHLGIEPVAAATEKVYGRLLGADPGYGS